MSEDFTIKDFVAADGVENWRVISDGACAFYATGSFAASARFVAAIGEIDGIDGHPASVDVRHDGVTVRFMTKRAEGYGLSARDLEMARAVEDVARDHGLTPDPAAIQSLLIIPGAPDAAAIMPFWEAVLGYTRRVDSPDEDLVDPHDRDTAFWFETMDEPRGDAGGAIHIAVWLPRERAESRLAASLAAGGRLVSDANAPSWWTLEDAYGNQVDIATLAGRD